ncbi:DUF4258 domain-containing protein [Candidatus Woesearchaeota archaeon]|nr:DUF4258 domain-containing protein [Candidatus Woesearchaeota archaeon]
MRVTFTSHALPRMSIRKIYDDDIMDTLRSPDVIYKKHGKYFFRKSIGRGTIELCCEKTERHINIVTLYWV